MARVLVAKAAESCGTREELVEQLSREVTSPASRRTFIDSCARGDPRATPVPPTAAAPPRPPSVVPIDPATLAKLTALLTERIGPVARVIVRRTAAKTSDVGALVDELAKQLPDATAREAFVAAARRYPPRA
jgi:serine/threonine-protein kinase